MNDEMSEFYDRVAAVQKQLDPEIARLINDHFWEMFEPIEASPP